MSLPNNYLEYPNMVQEPEKIIINKHSYVVHGFHFRGLQEFYDFLKSNPKINYRIWSDGSLASITNSAHFSGVPYDEAIEKLIQNMDPGYQEYIKIQKRIPSKKGTKNQYETLHSVSGGTIDPVAYATGSGKIYKTVKKIMVPKYITIDTQIAYNCQHNKQQVFNRALIITNLIKALEKSGYNVTVNSFMVAEHYAEIIKAVFEIKRNGKDTNYQALYKSLVDVEFFRRLCFRLIEISDVKTNWSLRYGHPSNENTVRKLLKLKEEDIYFDQPLNMGINGNEIGKDFENAIKHLKLQDYIDVEREKEILRQSVKTLRK